jgi:hypothetical protein
MEEVKWYANFVRDFGKDDPLTLFRPTPVPWMLYYLKNMKWDEEVGKRFSLRARKTAKKVSGDYQTVLQQVILDGDIEACVIQLHKETTLHPSTSNNHNRNSISVLEENNNSILHYAVLTRNKKMVLALLNEAARCGQPLNVNRNDLITGFTPLHFSVFVESFEIFNLLLREYNADIDRLDEFSASALSYARMLGIVPRVSSDFIPPSLKFYDKDKQSLVDLPISQFEEKFKVQFCPKVCCTHDYIEELMFSGFSIGERDFEFRGKYKKRIEETSGDEKLVLAQIDEIVGYGVFALKDFQAGDFIVRYGGCLTGEKKVRDRSYAVMSGVEGVVLDATKYRNLGGMINHSSTAPNAELQCFFDDGAEQAIVTALKFIPKGQQILVDYSESYWMADDDDDEDGNDEKSEQVKEKDKDKETEKEKGKEKEAKEKEKGKEKVKEDNLSSGRKEPFEVLEMGGEEKTFPAFLKFWE